MSDKKRIVWGDKPFDEEGEPPTHKVTSLYIQQPYNIVGISYELRSGHTDSIKLSMEMAQEIGLIDFTKLDKFLK